MNHKRIHTVLRVIMFALLWWLIACGIAGSPPSSSLATKPGISLSTSSIYFGRQAIQIPATVAVTVTNTGTANLVMSDLQLTGSNATDFAFATRTLPVTLAPNNSTSVEVTFTPTAAGERTALLSITHNAGALPQSLALSGTGMAPGISLSPASVSFADQFPNTRSAPVALSISNSGAEDLVISNLAITGANAGDFSFAAAAFPITVPPGGATNVSLTFAPAQAGVRTGTLAITDNVAGTPQLVALSGTSPSVAQDPAASVSITPDSGQAGNTITVTFQGTLTNFVQDATTADFGPGTITGAGDGLVAVNSQTSATVQVQVGTQAAPGPRQIAVSTGGHCSYVTFQVLSSGLGPVANAGPQQFAQVGDTVQLDGSQSTCAIADSPLGCLLNLQWSFLSTPEGSLAQLTNPTSLNPSFGVDLAGDYILQLSAQTDSDSSSAQSTAGGAGSTGTLASVVISTQGTSPVANAGPNQFVAATGSTVQLDGSSSSDADGNALTYQWTFLSVPQGSTAVLSDVTSVSPTFVVDMAGTYQLQLTVNDGHGNNASSTVLISTQQTPPTANAGADQFVPIGSTAQLDGSQSSDPDGNHGNPLSYAWSFTFKPAGSNAQLSGANSVNPAFTVDQAGAYGVQLVVTDSDGNASTSTVMISTNPIRPVAVAGTAQSLPVGGTVQLDGSESKGAPSSYQWFLISKPAGSAAALSDATQAKPTFVADLAGFYVAELVVSDGLLTSYPSTVLITATVPGFTAVPSAVAFGNQMAGGTSNSQAVVITNTGTGDLTIASLNIAGANAAEFLFAAASLPVTVAPGGHTTVNVAFAPTGLGNGTAVLNIGDNASGSPHAVALSGTGVVGPPASITAISGTGQSAAISATFAPLQAMVKDAGGNPVGGAVVTFSAPASGASGTFAGGANTAVTNSQGIASASFTPNGTAGSYTVLATVPGVSTPARFSLTNQAGSPATIAATGGVSQSVTINTAFPVLLQATVSDSGGNPVSGAIVTFAAPAAGASGTFAAGGGTTTTAVTNAQGVATAPALTANGITGSFTVTASVGSATANFSLTNQVGTPATVTATAGTPQSAAINGAFATALQAVVKDAGGNLVSGVTVTLTAPASGASGTFAGGGTTATAVTNAQGAATAVTFTANSTAGTYSVTATVAGVSTPASFALTNQAGPPATATATAGTPQSAAINIAYATALQATVKDASGNPVSGVTVTFTAPAAGASGTFAGGGNTTTAVTNAQGVATAVTFTANSTAGTYSVTATVAGVSTPASFALTNQAGPPATATATAGTPQSVAINTPFATALQVVVKDAGGNLVSGVTVTFAAPASGASGTFAGGGNTATVVTNAQGAATAPGLTANSTAGVYTVTASVGSATATFSLTNQVGPPASVTATAGTPQSVLIDNPFATALQAMVADAGGNALSGMTVTFTAPASGASGTFAGGGTTATAVTNAQGVATAPGITANGTAGPFTVVASVPGVTTPASFALANLAPVISISAVSVPFGNQPLRSSSAPLPIVIGNTGTANLVITNLTITGASAGDFSFTAAGPLPLTVVPNSSTTVNVTFAPTLAGSRVAALTIVDNASGSPHAVALSGTGINAPILNLNPSSVNFGSQLIYTGSGPLPVTVANNGTADLVISSLTITGANAQEFSLSAAVLPVTVGVNNATTINVVFTPGATGVRTATLTITDNAAGGPHTVALTGTGTAPGVNISPAALTFPEQPPQSTSAPATLMVSNTGSGNLVISTLTVTGANVGDFVVTAGTLPITVAPGNSTTLTVTFTPRGTGTRTATLMIADNAGNSPQTVALSGTSVTAPGISINPSSVNFGSQLLYTSSAPLPVTVANSGTTDLTISSLTITGANAQEFSLSAAVLPVTVGANETTTINIVFTPGATGVRTATLTITDNAAGSPHTVALSGTGTAPAVNISPAALNFPGQVVQSVSAPSALTVSNTGNGNLVISTLTITGANIGDFLLTAGTLPITVTPGNSTTLTVTFTPRVAGTRTATLMIADNAGTSPQTVALSGTATAPGVSISPPAVNFGSQLVSQAQGVSQPVAISNTGNGNLVISAVTVAGANASDFSATAGTLPVSVAPGSSANVNVTFTPTATGLRAASLSITSNADSSPNAVALSGTGTATTANIYPSTLNLGNSPVNTTSATQYVTVSNTGGANLVVSSIAISGTNAADFSYSWMTLPATISPMGLSAIAVTFTPSATGSRTATLTITDNATGSPQVVALIGNGTTPAIGLAPTSINFGNQLVNAVSSPTAITISNSGTATLVITSVAISGANAGDFAFTAPVTPIMVVPSGTATVSVTFTPAAAGARTASINFSDNASGSPQTVALSGTGIAPGISMNPASVAFGNVSANTSSPPAPIKVSNPGTANLVISGLSVTGVNGTDFTFTAGTLPITVAPGGNTTISVTFTPAAVGARAGTLNITDNAAGSPHTVGLSGTGASAAGISLSPTSLSFGDQPLGAAGALMPLTVTNIGAANLVISALAITGANASDFTYASGTLPITVTPGNSTTVNVTFTPAATGNRMASLSITDSAPASPQTVSLSGIGTAPIASVSPASVSFGTVLVNTTSPLLPVTVSNTGSANLVISQLAIAGGNSGDFTFAAAVLPITVAPGNSTTIAVSFTPAAAGARSTTLNITDNASGSPQSVALSGTGSTSTASMSVASALDLGSTLLNTTSAAKQVAISNTGSTNLVITALGISGPNASEFAFTSAPLPFTVGPSGLTAISVTFTPAGVGLRSATLTITDNAAGSPQSVALTGTGTGTAIITLSPSTSLAFGNQNVNTSSAAQPVGVGNSGTNNLVISGISILGAFPGDFAYSAGTLPITVAPGSNATINVVFTPSALGARTATLQLVDNANGSPHSLALSGNGVVPSVGINPSSVSFANQTVGTTSGATSITVSNTGAGSLVISNLALSGPNASDFAFSGPAMPVTVAAGNSITVGVTFSPTATGARSATLSVTDNASGSPQTVGLTGTGTPPAPGISLNPASVSFGNQPVSTTSATQPITVSNTGTLNLVISALGLNGANPTDFSLGAVTLPITVAPGGKTTLQVAFTPGAAGSRSGTLSITDNVTGSPQTVALTGTGTVPGFSVSPTTLNFGNESVDVPTAASVLTVTNTGTANLVISNLLISGANAGDFTFTAASQPITIAAGGTTNISVTFTPAGTGTRSATLNITDNATGSPHTVALSGFGIGSGANIEISPMSINFGNQNANTTSSPASVTLANTGSGNLVITALAITGANASDFALAPRTLPMTISPEGVTTLSLTFTPTAGGAMSATLSITDNANGSPHAVTLSGTGVVTSAAISISPTSVSFGSQTVGTTSTATPVTVSNTGTANLVISNVVVTGANAGDFAVASSATPITVTPGNSTTLYTTFSPTAAGSRSAAVSITDNATGSPHTVALSGTGVTPTISITPPSVAFGNQLALTTSAPVSVVIGNNGTGNLLISSLTISPSAVQFQFTSDSLPITVAPGQSTTVKVTFSPTALGNYSSSLLIATNATGSPQSVALSGTGTAPAIAMSPASVNFGNQLVATPSSATVVTVTNSGTANLVISGFAITGTNSAEFAFTSGAVLPVTITPGNSTTVSVTFTPAATGSRTASLNITDNVSGSPQTVALSGTGTAPGITVSPASINFGNQPVSSSSSPTAVTLTNSGTANLVISNLGVTGTNSGDFAYTSGTLPITVTPGNSTTVNVTFTPTATGGRVASLSISDNVSGSPQAVSLSGIGTAPVISLSPASVNFGNQLVTTTSPATAITLTNTGTGSLIVSSLAITGANAGDFAFTSGTLPITIAAKASTTVNVTFTPSATGSRTASLSITANTGSSAYTVPLSGTGTAPAVSLSSTSLNFGTQGVGTSTPLGVTVTNSGTGNLIISAISISGANASAFTFSAAATPITVTPGGNTIITVTFAPTTAGSLAATLSITDNASDSPETVSLSGSATAPVSNISPSSVAFGNQLVNVISSATSIVVGNSGTANLVISNLTITGTNATDFSFAAGALPITVSPGNRTYISVFFTPLAAGNRVATLVISDNSAASPETVPLSGTGTAAVVGVSPTSINFGNQNDATTSAPTAVTVSNTGTGSLVISSLTIAGSNPADFAYSAGTLPITVAAGSTAIINVTFKPTAPGARSAGLNIIDNAVTSPQTVALSGTGVGPAVSPSPSSVNFGAVPANGSSMPTTVTITNTGNANLVISSVAITGANSGDFVFTASATPITVTPGGTTAIQVTFQPKAGGSRSATLSITDNASGSPQSIPLSGTATGTGLLGMPPVTVGGNLEVLATATLTIAPPSSVTVTVTSGNPGLVLLSTDPTGTTAGSTSVTVTIAAGATAAFPGFYVQGLGSSGTVTLTLSAPGYTTATGTVTLSPAGFVLISPAGTGADFSTTLGSADTPLTVAAATLNSSLNVMSGSAQIRGGLSVTVQVTSATPATGTILGSAVFQGGSSTASGVTFHPLKTGTSVLSTTPPTGFSAPNTEAQLTATVAAPQISLYPTTVGSDLEVQGSGQLTVAAPATGVQVTITSQTPSTVLLSTSPTASGSTSIILTVGPNATALPLFYVQGLAVGTGQLSASAPGYSFSTGNFNGSVAITPSGVVIAGPGGIVGQNFSTTTISNPTLLTLTLMRLDPSDNQAQVGQLRGGASVSVGVQSGSPAIGTISSSPAVITGGESSVTTILFNPLTAGNSVLSVIQPASFSTPTSGAQLTAAVSQPQISLILPTTSIGANLQLQASGSLNASAPSLLNITVTSSDPTKVLLSNSATTAGPSNGIITVTVASGNGLSGVGFPAFFVQALQSSGSVTLTASAPGWATGTIVVNLAPSGFVLISPNGTGQNFGTICAPSSCGSTTLTVQAMQLNASTLAPQTPEEVAGGLIVNVSVGDNTPSVGTISGSPVAIGGGATSGTVIFQPLNTGTTLLSVTAPSGFSTPSTGASLNAGVN
jgi:hypothetical protein